MSELVYVLPVHNEEAILASSVARAREALASRPSSELLLIENGSVDRSWEIAQGLVREGPVAVRAYREDAAGIGWAYHRGLEEALARFGPTKDRWAVLTAVDLPFGFTDLAAAEPRLDDGSRMLIGSKAHPRSQTPRPVGRQVMTRLYRAARRAMLGMHVADSQGSVFLRLDFAAQLAALVQARNFFYSTELCFHAERAGERIEELPVVLEADRRGSTVRPWRHGPEMAVQLWSLRQRSRA